MCSLILLRKLGGSYVFIHRSLLEHFAQHLPIDKKQEILTNYQAAFLKPSGALFSLWGKASKFILDYILTVTSLIVLLPLLTVIAILVRISSPGPVLHKRAVMGLNGKSFYAYKFRTMRTDDDETLHHFPELKNKWTRNHTLKIDPRITNIGALLRKFSLDELPQLFNVLKRDMSLVGPRMLSPEELAVIYDSIELKSLNVLPGITGPWLVTGDINITPKERVQIEMSYIVNWSIFLDIKILFATIPAVLKGHGSY